MKMLYMCELLLFYFKYDFTMFFLEFCCVTRGCINTRINFLMRTKSSIFFSAKTQFILVQRIAFERQVLKIPTVYRGLMNWYIFSRCFINFQPNIKGKFEGKCVIYALFKSKIRRKYCALWKEYFIWRVFVAFNQHRSGLATVE